MNLAADELSKLSLEEKIDVLTAFFGWDGSAESRFSAFLILRTARRESVPSFDDFKVGKRR